MIYSLILHHHYETFATVKIDGKVLPGHNIRFKDLIYRVVMIDGMDLVVKL